MAARREPEQGRHVQCAKAVVPPRILALLDADQRDGDLAGALEFSEGIGHSGGRDVRRLIPWSDGHRRFVLAQRVGRALAARGKVAKKHMRQIPRADIGGVGERLFEIGARSGIVLQEVDAAEMNPCDRQVTVGLQRKPIGSGGDFEQRLQATGSQRERSRLGDQGG